MSPSKMSHPDASAKSTAKKDALLGGKKKSRFPLVVGVGAALLFTGGILAVLGQKGGDSSAVAAVTPANASASEVSFAAKDLDDGQAKFYRQDGGNGVTIRYYLVKAPDGSLKAALDACDACWSAGKGYKQSGDVMICRNCSRKFEIARIGEIHGGCNPVSLKSRIQGDRIVIETRDILAGRRYFDLPKGN